MSLRSSTKEHGNASLSDTQSIQFMQDVQVAFRCSAQKENLAELSRRLRDQFHECLQDSEQCMLPSNNHQLPTGNESGTVLALDVGGSTFRVALVELDGSRNGGARLSHILSFKIDKSVKRLKGVEFFDWMAEKIGIMISEHIEVKDAQAAPLSMGLAWSFPIEQTSLHSGLIQGMGKGFMAADGLLGKDLGDLIQAACCRRGLNVQLNAIVNDSSATLLSKAYVDPSTRFALILGTGVNAAIHLPVDAFAPRKLGTRPASWHESAKHVIVNTELSMFGGKSLPYTKWDMELRAAHQKPDFQPFEHFVSGCYLGEIVRLVLVDGIQNAGLFGGILPPTLKEAYFLETKTISAIELDKSPTLTTAQQLLQTHHPSSTPHTQSDLHALRQIANHVTHRAACIVAAGIHALWKLRNESEGIKAHESTNMLMAFNGSVMESYPGYRETCQKALDDLIEGSGGERGILELVHAEESSLLGAAVAVVCLYG